MSLPAGTNIARRSKRRCPGGNGMISIVIPAYNEERNLDVLYVNIREVLSAAGGDGDFEVVFVDDGSTDRTWDTINAL